MIHAQYWKMLTDTELERLDRAAVGLLEGSGARIESEELLAILEARGCKVDRAASRCFFAPALVRGAVAALGNRVGLVEDIEAGFDTAWSLVHGGSFPHYLDWPTCERRLARKTDVADMARMAHTLPEWSKVGRVLTCSEVSPRIEPLWSTLTIAEISDKPVNGGEIFYPDYIEPLVRMGEVLSGVPNDNSLIASCDFFVQPLILERNQAACFVEKRRFKCEINPGTMAVSGMSSPVTLAGAVLVSLAELLAGWTLGYVLDPTLPATGIVATGSLDMRTSTARFSSPEAILQNTAVANACLRLYGIWVWPCTTYTDCKVPGLLAAFNKMYGLLAAPFAGPSSLGTDGLLSAGQDYSPVQQILDMEINRAVRRFWGHFEVNDETMAADLIARVVRTPGSSFLDTEHTFEHWKTEQWYPRWLDASAWRGAEKERAEEAQMLGRIADYCRSGIRDYRGSGRDGATIRALREIYRSAEKSILG